MYIKITDIHENTVEIHKIESLYEGMEKEELNTFFMMLLSENTKMRKERKSNRYQFHCMCRFDEGLEIPLVLSRRGNTHYLKNFDIGIYSHKQGCNFDNHRPSKKAWDESIDGEIHACVEGIAPYRERDTQKREKTPETPVKNHHANPRTTLFGFLTHLVSKAQERKTRHEKRNISIPELLDFIKYMMKSIYIGKRQAMDIFCIAKTNKSMLAFSKIVKRKGRNMLVVGKLEDVREYDGLSYVDVVLSTHNSKENLVLACDRSRFANVYENMAVRNKPIIVGAWVDCLNLHKKRLTIVDIALVPVAKNGVWVESDYERTYFNNLVKSGRIFIKPYDAYKSFRGMKPDAIMIDTTPNTILEVFGFGEEDEIYTVRKKQKIRHFSGLKKYNFCYWDAFNKSDYPLLPPPNK